MTSPPKEKPGAGEQTGQISTKQLQPSNQGEEASTAFSSVNEAQDTAEKTGANLISDLRKLLGNAAVLLPIPRGCKGPKIKGWQHFTSEQMKQREYLAKLNHDGNIGVLLGHGLATIDLDQDKFVEPFLSLNPKLRETLKTRRVRGCNLWVRIRGDYPKLCKLKTKSGEHFGEWRADGNQTVIHGEAIDRKKGETEPTTYKIENRTQPTELAFDAIHWPDNVVLPWRCEPVSSPGVRSIDELRQLYGEPYYTNEIGISLNESFWAGLFASENIVLWEPSERAFYNYRPDTGIYGEESADAIKRRISDRLLKASRQMNCFELEKQRGDSRLNSIVAQLRGIVERRGAFAQRERRIHLANGVFSFANDGQLLAFSPEFVSRNRSPIVFDENATCERFLNELVYPAVHPEDAVLLQKYAGMCLLGNNLIQRILILDGETARGKTQFANVVQAIVGRENVTQLRTRLLGERFETYRFLKKTLLIGVDVEPNFLSTPGAAVIKGLVGGDWFDAEQKCGTGCFPVQGTFCVLVTSNTRLRVRLSGDVGAWRRRLLIVRYEAPLPRRKIPDFGALLVREEGPGILNYCIGGLGMLLRDIDQNADGDITLTDRQKKIVDSLLAESDSLRFFLRDRVARTAGTDVSVNEIIEAYAAFCPDMGWNPMPITEVHRSLEGLMLELFQVTKSHSLKRDGKWARGFSGVSLEI
jgi:phage/plasmid-associated DNA primase